MLFPNRAPAPQLRPGMGYTPGAHIGYVAHMGGYKGGAHLGQAVAYGSIDAVWVQNAESAGYQASDLQLLGSLGATDDDIIDLINGTITLQQLYAQYGVTTGNAPAAAAATATGASAAQSPPGSVLLYTATYNPVSGWTTAASAIQALSPLLPAYGMSLQSSQVSASGIVSNASFSITVLDSVGHALISDAKSVLDSLMNQITNNGLQSSTLTLVSAGTTATGVAPTAAAAAPISVTSWLENNAVYLGLGVAALVVLNGMMGKRR